MSLWVIIKTMKIRCVELRYIKMNCPVCNMDQSPTQPQSGTHAYTTVYQCGAQYTYIVGDDEYEDAMVQCPFVALMANQRPPDPEAQRIFEDNLWDLI